MDKDGVFQKYESDIGKHYVKMLSDFVNDVENEENKEELDIHMELSYKQAIEIAEEEVINKMNDNQYGLSSGVYTSNLSRGLRVSKAIRAGITFVNTYRLISPSAPFGGIKDSGYGKEAGIDSIKDYTRVKTTWFYTSDEPSLDPFSIR